MEPDTRSRILTKVGKALSRFSPQVPRGKVIVNIGADDWGIEVYEFHEHEPLVEVIKPAKPDWTTHK